MSAGPGASQSSGFAPVDLLTSSRLKCWRACPRQHHYRYELARAARAPESAASALGTTVHAALEAWWQTWQRDPSGYGALDAALYAVRGDEDGSDESSERQERDPYTAALTSALVIAYDTRWSRWAASVEVLGVEQPFVAPLAHPITGQRARRWAVAGKMDVLLRLSDGRTAIVDHKVTASDARVGSDWRRKLTLDPQVSTYLLGAAELGHPADLALWDVIQKPALRPHKAAADVKLKLDGTPRAGQRLTDETPDEYQERLIQKLADAGPEAALAHVEVVRTDAEHDAHAWALYHTVREIEESRAVVRACNGDVRAVMQNAGACMAYGSPCPFLPVCEGTASIDDPTRYRRLPVAHAELPAEMQVRAQTQTTTTTHNAHDNQNA